MDFKQNLLMTQTQQLVMTPQLQQAIKLLQLSRPELLESINSELMENPVLEMNDQDGSPEGPSSSEAGGEASRESANDVNAMDQMPQPTQDAAAERIAQSIGEAEPAKEASGELSIDQMPDVDLVSQAYGAGLHGLDILPTMEDLGGKLAAMIEHGGDAMRQLRAVAKKTDHPNPIRRT